MTKVRIKLVRSELLEVLHQNYFGEKLVKWVNNNPMAHETLPVMFTDKTRFAAAEEMFDLTNNPSRQAEREQVYGNGRSVSVGDIVEVDGVDFLCSSFGWKILD